MKRCSPIKRQSRPGGLLEGTEPERALARNAIANLAAQLLHIVESLGVLPHRLCETAGEVADFGCYGRQRLRLTVLVRTLACRLCRRGASGLPIEVRTVHLVDFFAHTLPPGCF